MSRLVKLNTNGIKINKKILEYVKPQIIYIPLENKDGVLYKHLIKEGDYVYKGQVVAIDKNNNDFPIHSSVSGTVINGTKKIMNNNKKIKCIVVENDFKEKYEHKIGTKKKIDNYTKEEFIKLLKDSGITGLSGSDFPTYRKYDKDNLNYLIVNGVECEPYAYCDKGVMREYSEEILEAIDAIIEINKLRKAYIIVKENDLESISKLTKYIGTYPNISIRTTTDTYPSGWDESIIKNCFNKTYLYHASEIGYVVNNVSTIYAIYEMLKYNRPLTERIITVTGEGIKKPTNVKVKIGASLSEIIPNIEGYKKIKNPLLISGGPMMGNSVSSDELVITKDLNCVLVIPNIVNKVLPCLNCGKCTNVCPVGLKPALIIKNVGNKKKLDKLKHNECIECGLCSYICPSKIEIREIIRSTNKKDDEDV